MSATSAAVPSAALPGLQADGSGRIGVAGPVTFATAGELLMASQGLFTGHKAITVDLAGVTSVDSAGLALLLEWLRRANAEGYSVNFASIPDKLVSIAKLSGVDEMLTARLATISPPAS